MLFSRSIFRLIFALILLSTMPQASANEAPFKDGLWTSQDAKLKVWISGNSYIEEWSNHSQCNYFRIFEIQGQEQTELKLKANASIADCNTSLAEPVIQAASTIPFEAHDEKSGKYARILSVNPFTGEETSIDLKKKSSKAPIKTSAIMAINAQTDRWQPSGVVLAAGEQAIVQIPLADMTSPKPYATPQRWKVIDPASRGECTGYGNGINAGPSFAGPNLPEGALIFRVKGQKTAQALSETAPIAILTGPGEIEFIANDDMQFGGAPGPITSFLFNLGRSALKQTSDFADNSGTIKVVILRY